MRIDHTYTDEYDIVHTMTVVKGHAKLSFSGWTAVITCTGDVPNRAWSVKEGQVPTCIKCVGTRR